MATKIDSVLRDVIGEYEPYDESEAKDYLVSLTAFVDGLEPPETQNIQDKVLIQEPADLTSMDVLSFTYEQFDELFACACAVHFENCVLLNQKFAVVPQEIDLNYDLDVQLEETIDESEAEHNAYLLVIESGLLTDDFVSDFRYYLENPDDDLYEQFCRIQDNRWENLNKWLDSEDIYTYRSDVIWTYY